MLGRGRHVRRAVPHPLLSPVLALAGLLLVAASLLQLAPGLNVWRQASAASDVLASPTEGPGPVGVAGDELVDEEPIVTTGSPSELQPTSPAVEEATSPAPVADNARAPLASSEGAIPAPVSVSIPSIGVQTKLIKLGLNADRSLQVPKNYSVAGWYTKGGAPGDIAPAVIVGHYDSVNGPAVFYRLAQVLPDAAIQVRRADGSVATFTVDRVRRFSKGKFPTDQVYGAVDRPELRLITCGGSFDHSTGHYRDNYVVFAHMV